ncbi:MAG: TspO/MBR family protein [Patescibacteria group bacterium]
MNAKFKNFYLFIISLVLPLLIGYLGSLVTTPAISTWYVTLVKPAFITPPNWLFGPVWTLLYIMMGIALFLVLKQGKDKLHFRAAWLSFGAQLFLNLYWSLLFFYIKSPMLAFYAIISLWSMIFVNIYYFYQIKKAAAYIMIPYIVWVTFAAALNYGIWYLN